MKDSETSPLSDLNEELKNVEYNKKYRKIFLTSICLNVIFLLIIIFLLVQLSIQKNNSDKEINQLINEKDLCEQRYNTRYYNLPDIQNHYKKNNENLSKNEEDNLINDNSIKDNKINKSDDNSINNNDHIENENDNSDINDIDNSDINDVDNNNDNSEEKPVLDISKDELLEMCYKSRAHYYQERRIQQNRQFPGTKYIDINSGTIQSKLTYLIVHESPDYKSRLVDKIRVHEYAKKVIGKDICVPIIKIYNNVNEINFDELPNKFVLKTNHGAAMNVIVSDKSKLNIDEAKKNLDKWIKRNFGLEGGEFQYINVERKIFAEEFLKEGIEDYKIYCFHGEPKMVRVQKVNDLKSSTRKKVNNYYSLDWELLDIETGRPGFYRDPKITFEKPPHFDLILSYARKLSAEFAFVRLDFYDVNGRVYLGEMTFSPSNVCFTLKNMEQSKAMGTLLDITKIKKYLFN